MGCAALLFAIAIATASAAQDEQPPAPDPAQIERHEALLDEALRRKDERQAREAVRLLANYPGDPRAAKALLAAAKRPGAVGRDAVAHLVAVARARPKGVDVVPTLTRLLGSRRVLKDSNRARTICLTLGAIGDGRAASTLMKLMKHDDLAIAGAAIGAATGMKSRRHKIIERMIGDLESLGSSMRDSREPKKRERYAMLSGAYAGAINAMTGQYFGTDTIEIRRWWKKNKRKVPNRIKPKREEKGREGASEKRDGDR